MLFINTYYKDYIVCNEMDRQQLFEFFYEKKKIFNLHKKKNSFYFIKVWRLCLNFSN